MISDDTVRKVLVWEQNWFRQVLVRLPEEAGDYQAADISPFIARRIMRHAVWYLRARHRNKQDLQAAWILLECLRRIVN